MPGWHWSTIPIHNLLGHKTNMEIQSEVQVIPGDTEVSSVRLCHLHSWYEYFFMSVHFQGGLVPTDRTKNKHLYFENKSEQWLKLDRQVSNPHGQNCIVLGLKSWNPMFVDSSHNSLFPLKQRSVSPSSIPFFAWMMSQNSPIPHENLIFQSVCKSFLVESPLLMGNSQCLPVYPIPQNEKNTQKPWFRIGSLPSEGHIILEYFIIIIDKLMIMCPNDVPTDGTWLLTIIHWEHLMLPEWDV